MTANDLNSIIRPRLRIHACSHFPGGKGSGGAFGTVDLAKADNIPMPTALSIRDA